MCIANRMKFIINGANGARYSPTLPPSSVLSPDPIAIRRPRHLRGRKHNDDTTMKITTTYKLDDAYSQSSQPSNNHWIMFLVGNGTVRVPGTAGVPAELTPDTGYDLHSWTNIS